MPDLGSINTVAAADVGSVDTVAKENIGSINGCDVPAVSAGSTQWGIGYQDGGIGYASTADLGQGASAWTSYYGLQANETVDFVNMAYGTNGSGVNRWVFVWTKGSGEIKTTNDLSAGGPLGGANVDIKLRAVEYCNDTWITGGEMKSGQQKLYTSTDGTSWTSRDLSQLSGIGTTDIRGFAHDGTGDRVIFTQDDSIYYSTDKGHSFAVALAQIDPSGSTAVGRNVVYLKDEERFVCIYHKPNQGLKFVTAAASDLTTWTSPVSAKDNSNNAVGSSAHLKACAAAGSTFLVCYGASYQRFTVSGSTITNGTYSNNSLPHGNVQDVASDGTGRWITAHKDGDLAVSSDDGASFSSLATGVQVAQGDDDIFTIAADVILPV